MNPDVREISGGCHCGTVRFTATLTDGLQTARRCTCSLCRMRGAVAISAEGDLVVTQGAERLARYQFNTNVAEHYFCSICGIYTHHRPRSNPNLFAVNAACLDGVSPFDFPELPVHDGIAHPKDTGRLREAGVLKFIPAD